MLVGAAAVLISSNKGWVVGMGNGGAFLVGEIPCNRTFDYYHHSRTHRALDGNAPRPRVVEPPGRGKVIAVAQVGGLHHRYGRAA